MTWPRPAAAATPPGSPRARPDGRRRGRRARRRRHAERGGQRPGRHATPRSRRFPAGRPTCSPGRSACPTTRSRPPARCSTRSRKQRIEPRRPRLGERPLLPVPRRHRLRRRRRGAGRAARRAQAVRRPPLVHLRGVRDLVPPLRPQPPALRGALRPTAPSSTTATSRSASTPTPTRTSATGRSTSRPRRRSTAACRCSRCDRSTLVPLLGVPRRRRSGSARDLRRQRTSDLRTDVDELTVERLRPVPVPGRRRLPRRDRAARVPPRTRDPPPRPCSLTLPPARSAPRCVYREHRARATSGTLVTMPSTPSAASSAMRSGSSTVHTFTARPRSWHSADERGVDGRVARDAARRARRPATASTVRVGIVEHERQQRGRDRRVEVAHTIERRAGGTTTRGSAGARGRDDRGHRRPATRTSGRSRGRRAGS